LRNSVALSWEAWIDIYLNEISIMIWSEIVDNNDLHSNTRFGWLSHFITCWTRLRWFVLTTQHDYSIKEKKQDSDINIPYPYVKKQWALLPYYCQQLRLKTVTVTVTAAVSQFLIGDWGIGEGHIYIYIYIYLFMSKTNQTVNLSNFCYFSLCGPR